MDAVKRGSAVRHCEKLGFTRNGEISRHARSATGSREATVLIHHWMEGVAD